MSAALPERLRVALEQAADRAADRTGLPMRRIAEIYREEVGLAWAELAAQQPEPSAAGRAANQAAEILESLVSADDFDEYAWRTKVELARRLLRLPPDQPGPPAAGTGYQEGVASWMQACFGPAISADRTERNHRFLEEALELVQCCGCTETEAQQLVAYVFGRPAGWIEQEVGGVMVTLAALCNAHQVDLQSAADNELSRVWGVIEKIRAKQAAKPKHSPLPEPPAAGEESDLVNHLVRDNQAMRAAGGRLAEAAFRVIHRSDGLHRLALAVAAWAKVVADEGGRPHGQPEPPDCVRQAERAGLEVVLIGEMRR